MVKLKKYAAGAGALVASGVAALADGGPADPTTITSTATTAFTAVSVLVVTVVGFYIVVKIVRGIKGR